MKKIFITCLSLIAIQSVSGQATIAVLPAEVTITGNIPPKMTTDQFNQLRNQQARNTQLAIANIFARHAAKRKNRKLNVRIITPQERGYQSNYVISSQLQHTMIMSPQTAAMINYSAFMVNMNTPMFAPYVRPSANYLNFSLIERGSDKIVDVKRGSVNRSARRFFRKMRNGQIR